MLCPLPGRYYESFTNYTQPAQMTKFDLVAVPGKWNAMENW